MKVLRSNKDSVMAMLEAFVYDPLINWRLLNTTDTTSEMAGARDVEAKEGDTIGPLPVLQLAKKGAVSLWPSDSPLVLTLQITAMTNFI